MFSDESTIDLCQVSSGGSVIVHCCDSSLLWGVTLLCRSPFRARFVFICFMY